MQTFNVILSDDEWRLIRTLREIPPSPLRNRVTVLLDEIAAFVREPRCAEMQADGVPCCEVGAQCEQCAHVTAMIDGMARAAGVTRSRARS